MIFIDRLIRLFNRDFFLPNRCNATFLQQIHPCKSCKCKIFCRKLPNKKPFAPIFLNIKK